MKHFITICLVLYLLAWVGSGLYFGNAGIMNNQYFTEIKNIPKEDFERVPYDTIRGRDTLTQEIRYKIYKDSEGNSFATKGDMEVAEIQSKIREKWLFEESEALILILASCFLGALGSVIRLVKDLVIDKMPPDRSRLLLLPVAGFFNGFIILSISYAVPKYLTSSSDVDLNPASVMVLSLIAGIYVEIFLTWLNSVALSLFKSKS